MKEAIALTADQLDEKYNPDGGGEHPEFRRDLWRDDVANEYTLQGYWAWVERMVWEQGETQ